MEKLVLTISAIVSILTSDFTVQTYQLANSSYSWQEFQPFIYSSDFIMTCHGNI